MANTAKGTSEILPGKKKHQRKKVSLGGSKIEHKT
jgi:hypothetical protein